MASRFSEIQKIPDYKSLPLDDLMKIGLLKDQQIQSTLDTDALKLQQFGNLQTVYTPDAQYTQQRLADANTQLQEIAKMDVTSPEGQSKFNELINGLSNDQGLINGQQRTKVYQDTQDQIAELTKSGKYNDARALQWKLDSTGFDNRTDINDAAKSKDLTSSSNIQPGYDINDDKFKAFNALKAHNLLDPNIIQNLQNGYSFTDQGVDPTTIFNAISNTLSDKAQEQYLADFKYQKYQNGELNDFNKLSPQEQQNELSTYIYNDIAGFANTYKYDNPDLVKDVEGKVATGSIGSSSNKQVNGLGEVPGYVTGLDGKKVADKLQGLYTPRVIETGGRGDESSLGFTIDWSGNKERTYNDLDKFTQSHLDQFSTISPDMKNLYTKYKAGTLDSAGKKTLFAATKNYYENLPTHVEDWFVPNRNAQGTPMSLDIPNWQVADYIDADTGELVSGKDIMKQSKGIHEPKDIGRYMGASGIESLVTEPDNRAKVSTGTEVHIPIDEKGNYKSYIMLNPNPLTPQEKVISAVNSSALTPQLEVPVYNTDYKIKYIAPYKNDPGGYKVLDNSGKELTLNSDGTQIINSTTSKLHTKDEANTIVNSLINQPGTPLKTNSPQYSPQPDLPYLKQKNKPLKVNDSIPAFKDPNFSKALSDTADNLGIDSKDLMGVILNESGGNPSIKNPNGSATGLIQFIESTAKNLGTSTSELKNMSASEQMKYVQKYLVQNGVKPGASAGEIYAAVFLPGRRGQKYLTQKGENFYDQNKRLDFNKDGYITIDDLDKVIAGKLTEYNYN